jgi:hypothetical protein
MELKLTERSVIGERLNNNCNKLSATVRVVAIGW